MLNYHWLYYFLVTAKKGSMTVAAHALGVTQPTVSALIQDLEQALDHSLFDRSGRSLTLTESGSLVLKYAEEIFSLGSELESVLTGGVANRLQTFTVGIADEVSRLLTQRIIDPVYAFEPALAVHCLSDSANQLLAKLAVHEVDIVITDALIPANLKVKAFHHLVIDCPVTFVAQKELAKSVRRKFPNSLKGQPLLLPAHHTSFRQNIDLWLTRNNIKPFVRAEFEDTGLMKIAGAHGHGIFPVPEIIVKEVCKDYNVEKITTVKDIHYRLYVISLERKVKHPVVSRMIETLGVSR